MAGSALGAAKARESQLERLGFYDLVLLPTQTQTAAPRRPEHRLMLAVFENAIDDLTHYSPRAARREHRQLHNAAADWIASPARDWLFSFVRLCEVFGLDEDATRRRLLGHDAP
jgi:hypothetical protein